MMDIRTLQWDSDFFGLRIGRVDLLSKNDALLLISMQNDLRQKFDLLYVFDINNVGFETVRAKKVDEKVLYRKTCKPSKCVNEVSFFSGLAPTDDLYRLALISGVYSRFKLDERLPVGSYERLYTRWIENACPCTGSNKQILVYKEKDDLIKGMATFDYSGGLGHIGLVAVLTDMQRKGIGQKLISTLENYLYGKGVTTLEVPTQKNNANACCWYEKNGFAVQSVTPIYHWWL